MIRRHMLKSFRTNQPNRPFLALQVTSIPFKMSAGTAVPTSLLGMFSYRNIVDTDVLTFYSAAIQPLTGRVYMNLNSKVSPK